MTGETSNQISTAEALRRLDTELLALIRKSLATPTTSLSSVDAIVTGNAYQAVDLRGEIEPGFRRADPQLFAGMPMQGKRFIDLGANLGEKTRLAARAGTEYAEGIEYEEYFVRIGGLIGTYDRIFNAILRQGDITQPGCIKADFDIGACFSAFVYVRRNLAEILGHIRTLFLLETHAIEAGWFEQYVTPVTPIFPYWLVYGLSDHGRKLTEQRRAQIAFMKDQAHTGLVAIRRAEAISADHHDIRTLNLRRSRRAGTLMGNQRKTRLLFCELRRSISALGAEDRSDLATLIRQAIPALAELRAEYGPAAMHFGTDQYWLMLFQGLIHHIEHLGMTPANPYLVFLRELVSRGSYDPGMTYELADDERAVARIGPRLERIIEILLTKRVPGPLVVFNPLSVARLAECDYAPTDAQLDEHIHIDGGGEYRIQYIDGNHRLAALWLSGAEKCPVLPAWTNIFGLDAASFQLFPDADAQNARIIPVLSASVMTI